MSGIEAKPKAPALVRCTWCKKESEATVDFCPHCGVRLPQAPPKKADEAHLTFRHPDGRQLIEIPAVFLTRLVLYFVGSVFFSGILALLFD